MIEFKKAIRNLRLDITDYECEMLFSLYEIEGSGQLDYEEFMNLLIVHFYIIFILYMLIRLSNNYWIIILFCNINIGIIVRIKI